MMQISYHIRKMVDSTTTERNRNTFYSILLTEFIGFPGNLHNSAVENRIQLRHNEVYCLNEYFFILLEHFGEQNSLF